MQRSVFSTPGLTAAALIASTCLAGTAVAQAQSPAVTPQYNEVEDESKMVEPFNLSVDALEGMEIQGADGKEIGDVDEVLTDNQGQMTAVSAEVGGFLGVGEKEVVIGLDKLRKDGKVLKTDLSRQEIEQLQSWEE